MSHDAGEKKPAGAPVVDRRQQIMDGLLLVGAICFLVVQVLAVGNLGFTTGVQHAQQMNDPALPGVYLWLVNGSLGLLGGALMNPKRVVIAAASGLVAALSITGLSMLYGYFRHTVLLVEMLIPLGLGVVPGLWLHDAVTEKRAPRAG